MRRRPTHQAQIWVYHRQSETVDEWETEVEEHRHCSSSDVVANKINVLHVTHNNHTLPFNLVLCSVVTTTYVLIYV